jgi:hypothetical protein
MGNKLDHIIGLSFLLEPQTNFPFSLFPENEIPDWLNEKNNPFKIKKISNSKLHFEFSQDKWEQSRLIVPDHESGPDLAILGEILIFFGNKFSSIGNVKSSEVLNNFKKTDLNNFYFEVTKDQDRLAKIQLEQELIQKCVENHNVKGIIRVHVVLPSKAKSQGESCKDFIPGVRIVKNMLKIDDLIVDVDKSNLSAILGEKNANLILSFTSKK